MLSHDVRIWGIKTYKGKIRTTYTLRWRVVGKDCSKTYPVKALAESRRVELVAAQRRGEAFDHETGLPESEMRERLTSVTFYSHGQEFLDMKWPRLEPGSRRSLASAMATLTLALVDTHDGEPEYAIAFRALSAWGFNKHARAAGQPEQRYADAIAWVEKHSLPLAALADPKVARVAYNATTTSHDGKQFAANTYSNKSKGLSGAIKYGIELGRLTTNPMEKISTTPPRKAATVDRRVLANPSQARALIAAVAEQGRSGPRLVAFFAVLYYAGLRPSEALGLRVQDCTLSDTGWGELCFEESTPYAAAIWTDEGEDSPRKALKHRAKSESRTVPASPELVAHLKAHIKTFDIRPGALLFTRDAGGSIRYSTFANIWSKARLAVFTDAQAASPLAKRPYDLRHACLSTWLNAGVPVPQIVKWAGHSVQMLLSTYANCIDGQEKAARDAIDKALEWSRDSPDTDT